MQKIIIVLIFLFTSNLYSQVAQTDNYQFFIDLNKAGSETIELELITPKINSEVAEYKLPSMVPGTYKIYNFGRFVSDLKAFDNSGGEISVNKKDTDTWEISDANRLYKITYKIDDTFGDSTGIAIFEPAGTSIDKDTVFVFNNHGFFGYFNDHLANDYTLNFKKPSGFYGSTSLVNELRTDSEEIFNAPDYNFLVDNPIMFCVPDTTTINFEETRVLLSVYSPGKGMTSADLAPQMTKLLNAIRTFLGGKFSADRYTFIYYFSDKQGGSGGFGALEHNYSSFYYMPDVPKSASPYMVKQLMSTSAHEFYHTITPLNLHSEEIGNFDFNDPKMSEHLWLYEGVTEYNADYIQLREGLMDLKEFTKAIENKINGAASYNDTLPFTVLSKGALNIYEDQYLNVYQKGALIGLCLDILIREESNGSQSLQDVINELIKKYGKERSFKDEDLFNEITSMTSPKVGEFLTTYVSGPNAIPYSDILSKVGLTLKSTPYEKINEVGISMGFNDKTYRLVVREIKDPNSPFIKDLGIKTGDELISFNGNQITFQNARGIFGSYKNQFKKGDKFELEVARINDNGKESKEKLTAVISDTKTAYENKVVIIDNLTDQQTNLQNAWLGK